MKTPQKIFFILFFQTLFYAQPPSIQWQKCFGGLNFDFANDITICSDGGYVFVGTTLSSTSDINNTNKFGDIWIVKINNFGVVEWEKNIGGSKGDNARSVKQTADNGFIIACNTQSEDFDFRNNHGIEDISILKLDLNGTIQWQKNIDGSGLESAYTISQTIDGGYVISGSTCSIDNHGNFEKTAALIIKLSSNGTFQWNRKIGDSNATCAYSIKQTRDGGYVIGGSKTVKSGFFNLKKENNDAWIAKISNSGIIQWQKTYGGTKDDNVKSILQTIDGGFIVAGSTESIDGDIENNHGDKDAWILKLSISGNLEWQKCFGGLKEDKAESIQQTFDKGFLIAGSTKSNDGSIKNHGAEDAWVLKLSSNGSMQWQKCFGGSDYDYANSIKETIDGGFIVAGTTLSNDLNVKGNHGSLDAWVFKLMRIKN